ncbi:replication protein [Heyndrickxia acidiproducens]|uniref:replication protein n=1 Tax=Heyndrickxia acidiproducens TaxID=1121084 RepID=UPI0009D948BD|nr:replication protein [Heyndrickxia acidiproducens]
MANPQIDNGNFTRIANEILEHVMKLNLNGTQFRLLLAIWRFTYGFKRTKHELSVRYLANAISAGRNQVDRELSSLIERMIIVSYGNGARGSRILGFNKNWEEWGLPAPSPSLPQKPAKKPRKAKVVKNYPEDSTYYKMAVYFHDKVTAVAKDAGVEHLIKKANLQKYADEFRKLIELDGVDKHLAKDVMDWVTQDPFWRTNILSAAKLRQKFGELAIKMQAQKQPKQQKRIPQDPRDKEIAFQRWIQAGGDPNEFNWSD